MADGRMHAEADGLDTIHGQMHATAARTVDDRYKWLRF